MIELKNIYKTYSFDEETISILNGISLNVAKGEFIAIKGASGSGKTTLLNILGCIDVPTKGSYYLDNVDILKLNAKELAKIRNEKITFIFQNFALMEKYTAYENIELPLLTRQTSKKERRELIYSIAKKLSIETQLSKKPKQMSGGQQQRISIARALITGADIILADEPTGALDNKTGIELMDMLKSLNGEGKTIIMVTHNPLMVKYASRVIKISDGGIENDC